jgi:hypothetical protein
MSSSVEKTQHAPIRSIRDQLGRQPRGSVQDPGLQDRWQQPERGLPPPDLAFHRTAPLFTSHSAEKKKSETHAESERARWKKGN